MVKIFYDNQDVFSGISPTPIVGRGLSPIGETYRCGLLDSISLDGQITGCTTSFDEMWEKFQTLTNRFSRNFRNFIISGDQDGIVYRADNVIVKNISVGQSRWFNILPYTINLDIYNSGEFQCMFGVSDTNNEFSFTDNNDCTISLNHTSSALGFNTDKTAIQNAKDYVQSVSGLANCVVPNFIPAADNVILISLEERVDRFGGTYSLIENYIYDPNNIAAISSGILRYTLEYTNEGNISNVKVAGNIKGGRTIGISTLRNSFSSVDFYTIANNFYKKFGSDNLFETPRSFSSNENPLENSIEFVLEYSNEVIEDPYLIDTLRFSNNYSDGTHCVLFNGIVESNIGCGQSKWDRVLNFYQNFNSTDYINSNWTTWGQTQFELSTVANTITYGEDMVHGRITFGVEYCNNRGDDVGYLQDFNYSISFQPGINQYVPKAILDGHGLYCIQNLNYRKRGIAQIQGSAKISNCGTLDQGIADLKTQLTNLVDEYIVPIGSDIIMLSENISTEDNNTLSFSLSYSFENADLLGNLA